MTERFEATFTLRDEFSAAAAQMAEIVKRFDREASTARAQSQMRSLQSAVGVAGREVSSALKTIGLTAAFTSGGIIASITGISVALTDFARHQVGLRYTAEEAGYTFEQFRKWTALGQTIGQTQEQSANAVRTFGLKIGELVRHRQNSPLFSEIAREGYGTEGWEFAQEIARAGEKGSDYAFQWTIKALQAKREQSPRLAGAFARSLGLDTIGWADVDQAKLNKIFLPDNARFREYLVAVSNLGISFDNLKWTIGDALIPTFTNLDKMLDGWVQRSSPEINRMVGDFARWLESIKWDDVGKHLKVIFDAIAHGWEKFKTILPEIDGAVKIMGGWGPVLSTLTAVSLTRWLQDLIPGFNALGKVAWILPVFAGMATAFGMATPKTQAAPGAGAVVPSFGAASPGGGAVHGRTEARREGGPVRAGGAYVVGENGPEIFTPGQEGRVTPSSSQPSPADWIDDQRTTQGLRSVTDDLTKQLQRLNDYLADSKFGGSRGGGGGGGVGAGRARFMERISVPHTGASVRYGGGGSGRQMRGGGGNVDAKWLYDRYVEKFRNSRLNGYVPKDGAQWGIVNGTPEEWARLALATSQQESSLHSNARNGGLNQFNPADLARYGLDPNKVSDPDTQAQALVNQFDRYIIQDGVISGPGRTTRWGGAAAYFEPFRTGDNRKFFDWAGDIAKGSGGGGGTIGNVNAPGDPNFHPKGLLVHHTGGRSVEGARSAMRQKGLSVQYIIDREGNIIAERPGRYSSHAGSTNKMPWLGNSNLQGVEVVGKDENDILPVQRQAIARLAVMLGRQYGYDPKTNIWGHGEVTSRKEWDEGSTARMIREGTIQLPSMINPQWSTSGETLTDSLRASQRKRTKADLDIRVKAPPGSVDVDTSSDGVFQDSTSYTREMSRVA